ncbi:DUF6503 family protein [Brumimicrobium aurantiacum]|uniref:Deoxyribose-phosphate aldolase n=1 Tax=Brumimicrobium aurantiacum TaxID=1737063 RepID=A0A3E1EYS0_9FLAO|nr:DUF6503 family protein [Brumimicrobium aurantiacum]RFC54702.1 hypothetical protein DXU93_06865 [Brumimicrobium aurantiacum]
MNKLLLIFTSLLLVVSCAEKPDEVKEESADEFVAVKPQNVEAIIDSVYRKSGVEKINQSDIYFKFRKFDFAYVQGSDGLERSRSFLNDEGDRIVDLWRGDSVIRTINDEKIDLSKKKENAYKNSINSVFYFGYLPKALKDPAVNSDLIDTVQIKNKDYYKIKVTFDEEGGGEDYHDIFLYWIGVEDYALDYLAYQYFTNDGGIRFRAVDKITEVDGIEFRDYLNYAPKENLMNDYFNVDQVFENDGLEVVSEIRLEEIVVE